MNHPFYNLSVPVRFVAIVVCAGFLVWGSGCVTKKRGAEKAEPVKKMKASEPVAIKSGRLPYFEYNHDGRIYVIGDAATAAAFKKSPELPFSQAMVGEGPKGETVVVQADPKDSSLQERLWKTFSEINLYYAEEVHDGRVYIMGTPTSHLKFLSARELSSNKTMVGAGKNGETLVFELDPRHETLAARLLRQYQAHHGVTFE